MQNQGINPLQGYDTRGRVYDAGNYIIRTIPPEYRAEGLACYKFYKEFELNQYGIVETELDETETSLRHKKHIISYPYEWTANMFKDAVSFHLDLFVKLGQYRLTLKDALPCNIVFNFYQPVFVDFFSILPTNELIKEKWLEAENYRDPRFAVFDKMAFPYLLIPLLIMGRKQTSAGRTMLSEKACNCNNAAPNLGDLLAPPTIRGIKSYLNSLNYMADIYCQRFQCLKKENGFIVFSNYLSGVVKELDVTPPKSNYVAYYESKKEDFVINNQANWKAKQKNIYSIISQEKPKKVLDIGANTGWFSILAEKLGAAVIAIDIDESAMEMLYLYAKNSRLKILPLVIPFDGLTKEIYGASFNDPVYQGRDFQSVPLYLAATQRFKSDMVMVLGLLHHLILGEGRDITNVLDVLSQLTDKTLILEFIDLNDKLIQDEPSFFKNIHKYTQDNYNLELIINHGKKYFSSVKLMDSHPQTRKLIIFKK